MIKKQGEEIQENKKSGFVSKVGNFIIKKIAGNKILFVKIVVGTIVVAFAVVGVKSMFTTKVEARTDAIREEIVKIGELASLEYNYTKLSQRTRKKSSLNPFSSDDQLLYTFDGVIKLGINCKKLDISRNNDVITVKMPPIEILSHEIDEESYRSYVEEGDFKPSEASEYRSEDMLAQEEKIMKNGGIERAAESAKETIEHMINMSLRTGSDDEQYTIEFIS